MSAPATTSATPLARWPAKPVPRFFDPVDFGLGQLVPVVGGHPGAGASGVALALADAAAAAGLRTLLIDGADPARSGLANIWTSQLRSDPPCRDGATIGTVSRAGIVGRQLRGVGRPVPARIYPWLPEWASAQFLRDHGPFEVTVVDVGWNAWTGFNEVRFGPLAWVGAKASSTSPVLVAAPTSPSLRLTAGVHARWSAALASREVDAAPQLALADASAVPPIVRLSSPPSLADLLGRAVCFPHVAAAARGGWTENRTPGGALAAANQLLNTSSETLAGRLPTSAAAPHRFRRTPKET